MDNYEHTIKTWDQLAQRYQDIFMDLKLYDESYDLFCNYLTTQHATILEIGCGPGNITKYLLRKRPDFKIHATDVAPSMIALAKKNNPSASFTLLDCRNISILDNKFNAIVCGFCLPYLAEADFQKLVEDSTLLLEKDGLLYLSTIEGNYENSNYESSSDGLHRVFVYYYDEARITKTLQENNYSVLERIRIPYTKGDGTKSTHLIFIAQKTS